MRIAYPTKPGKISKTVILILSEVEGEESNPWCMINHCDGLDPSLGYKPGSG